LAAPLEEAQSVNRRVFFDANVIFTAAYSPAGKASTLIAGADRISLTLFTSPLALDEARRNLATKAPHALPRLDRIAGRFQLVKFAPRPCPLDLPAKDEPIFLGALACGAGVLLTGDRKDFGRYMEKPERTEGVLIVTVARFIEAYMEPYMKP
jgi:uncharacterized protein